MLVFLLAVLSFRFFLLCFVWLCGLVLVGFAGFVLCSYVVVFCGFCLCLFVWFGCCRFLCLGVSVGLLVAF